MDRVPIETCKVEGLQHIFYIFLRCIRSEDVMYGAPYIVDSSTSTAQAQVRLENEFTGDKSIMHM